MFDLDAAVARLRRQMADGGIAAPDVLDELESHLRDEVEQQSLSGASLPQAFASATERLGHAHALKAEFRKAGGLQEAWERAKHITLTLAGVP
ncbi:MAG: hypothetical protein L0Z53_25185, partial [Acidobacteriales bacterium]|nr:hypothetical protein [Terriglobales bacterium]